MTVALLLSVVVRTVVGQPTLAETIGDRVVVLIPGNLFEIGIQLFGPLAKKLLFVALSVAQVLLGGGVALALDRFRTVGPRSLTRSGAAALRATLATLVVLVLLP